MALAFTPENAFHSQHYLNHNRARQDHLATLDLDLNNKKVLEVGAGIGDHTKFFLDRGCDVLVTEARDENIATLRRLFPQLKAAKLDLEKIPADFNQTFDVVYAYGTLYHLSNPAEALAFFAKATNDLLLLETCVSPGDHLATNICNESVGDPTQSYSGHGCRPTRPWIFAELKRYFPFVYMPITQPNHPEFPNDWTNVQPSPSGLVRAVFIASKNEIVNTKLTNNIPKVQINVARYSI